MKNIYGGKIDLYEWQQETSLHKDVLVIAPTGAGKTAGAYNWAFSSNEYHRVIFTAPIKALSNERYFELKRNFGKDKVGIITGDIKINENAKILCMTQEIYTNSFAELPNQKVIIDEIHYLFQDKYRARSYAEGLKNTSENSDLMLLSATLNLSVKNYFNKIAQREFKTIFVKNRPVKIHFQGRMDLNSIKFYLPALVFVFSIRGIIETAEEIAYELELKPNIKEINNYANKFKIKNYTLLSLVKRGVGIYHGKMKYKEKLFIESLFRKKIIQVVVGTDSLALGVNLPAKSVIFGQLAKYYDGPITKREFLQMAGRAGRPMLWDEGFVGYMETAYESKFYNTEELYQEILDKELELEEVIITIDKGKIIKNIEIEEIKDIKTGKEEEYIVNEKILELIEKEIEMVNLLSTRTLTKEEREDLKTDILKELFHISFVLSNYCDIQEAKDKFSLLKRVFFEEFSLLQNFNIACFLHENKVSAKRLYSLFSQSDNQREQLQFLKFLKRISKLNLVTKIDEFEKFIEAEDEFVVNPEKIEAL